MNILFYCDEYPPFKTGGIGSVTKIVAESLASKGHNVYIVGYYFTKTTLPFYSKINNVHVYRLRHILRKRIFTSKIFSIFSKLGMSKFIIQKELNYTEGFIATLIKKEKIDIVELTDYFPFNAFSKKRLSFRKYSVPTILRIHGCISYVDSLSNNKKRLWIKQNDTDHFNRCDYISSVSKSALDFIKSNYKITNKEELVIYNPLEKSFFKKQNQSDSKEILYIGRLTESKGCITLIKAFNLFLENHNDWKLKIIAGGDKEKFQKLVNTKYLSNVEFMGYCTRETIQNMIDQCSFACIPSYFETFGMVAIEVMARSRALIFTKTTSGPEIINNGIDGLLVNPKSISETLNAMSNLANNSDDRQLIAENGYKKVVSNFMVDKIVSDIERFYLNIK